MFSISPLVNWDSAVPSNKAVLLLHVPCWAQGDHRQPACMMLIFEHGIVAKDNNSKNAVVYLSLALTMNGSSNDKNKTKVVYICLFVWLVGFGVCGFFNLF